MIDTAARVEAKNNWFNALTVVQQGTVHNLATAMLNSEFEGTGQGISSSDVSCKILSIYEDYKRSGITSIFLYCLNEINELY